MFSSVKSFKDELTQRAIRTYGHEVEEISNKYVYIIVGDMIREYSASNWNYTHDLKSEKKEKKLFYFSIEFLMGRLFTNNMLSLGIYDIVKNGLAELNIDINEIEDMESDAGLGNGGLGRLAACFLDSIASLGLPGNGNSIRYEYGFFKQKIIDYEQHEVPDQWLSYGNVWEVKKLDNAVDVKFYGNIDISCDKDNNFKFEHNNAECVRAVPYDMPIVGYKTKNTNALRLWSAEVSENIPITTNYVKYLQDVKNICQNLYPDDSTDEGKILRLKQEYFFVAAGLSSIIKDHLKNYDSLDNLHKKVVIQLNDTHPVLCIPELMRILMDEHGYQWEKAWNITTNTMAYTNHTVLEEALEKWPIRYIQPLLPRIFMIIQEIDSRFNELSRAFFNGDMTKVFHCQIIRDGIVHMGNLAVVGSFSVNGVAKIHSNIIKETIFNDFYKIWPSKFSNKTNGITQRRWLLYSNPELCEFLDRKIGTEYRNDLKHLEKLLDYVDDYETQMEFLKIKQQRKVVLADLIMETTNIKVDVNSIFDTQAKRLHAYKRQLLNVLHIIHLYYKIKNDRNYRMHPQTFIFAAKAAPSYALAKKIIKLINCISAKINEDARISNLIKVVFIPNYSVSIAEKLMNATDVSEQISTAGKEASGTGNMKFMMNGAITLGTLDGANIEIDELVGRENDIIFGLTKDEVYEVKKNYSSFMLYNKSQDIKLVVDSLINGEFSDNLEDFRLIYDDLLFKNDEYLVLKDFDAYLNAQKVVQTKYKDKQEWAKSCLINIAKSGFFSSDRTIMEYSNEIWKIKEVK